MENRYIFLGGIWLEEEEKTIIKKSRGTVQSAANELERKIIGGLDEVIGRPTTIINEIFIGSYPKLYDDCIIKAGCFNHSSVSGHVDYNVGFLNLPYVKHISRFIHSKKVIRKVCKENENTQLFFIGYGMTRSIIDGLVYAKKIQPNAKTCLIVPDLPEYMNLSVGRHCIFDTIKKIDAKYNYQMINRIDSFVVLTKYMYPRLNVKKPFIVIEGIVEEDVDGGGTHLISNQIKKTIVYTGTLEKKYGICELIDSFCQIQGEDLQLVICGKGNSVPYIEEKAKADRRIKYLGTVQAKEARMIQQNAFILVNPRCSTEEFTKYSFPSKNLEYLASGRPVIMYKLAGIPDEYDKHVYYVKDNLKSTLEYVLSLSCDELNKKGREAKEFVLKEKNPVIQTKRIIRLIQNL